METHYFTFGQNHTAKVDLPHGGRLADYWVAVEAPNHHRMHFIQRFVEPYCPRPAQWAFEYDEDRINKEYFPKGELTRIVVREGFDEYAPGHDGGAL